MHVHEALKVIKEVHSRIINSEYFYGYSSFARFIGGVIALLCAFALTFFTSSTSLYTHFISWGITFVIASSINYIFLFSKLKFSKENIFFPNRNSQLPMEQQEERVYETTHAHSAINSKSEKPSRNGYIISEAVITPLLHIVTGGVLTISLAFYENFNLLFGIWAIFFGFANISVKKNFSKEVILVGYFYIFSGLIYLLAFPYQNFTNPWPMGIIFFIGETFGAYAFYKHNKKEITQNE